MPLSRLLPLRRRKALADCRIHKSSARCLASRPPVSAVGP
jgi:hypothetical protein